MLSALELVGFKSFADKTRFEFPAGITVVVGPNGSGKSNIVDAIKWVLGEQSVKSLRGKEMADVIFNGSASRKPLNAAECTLTFNNSTRLLGIDASEVHITRRVYRSGEGEYLINRQPCRLRDIRDLFAGTGVATEAYSVIEQGKVDVMLQASPRDRRMIFEEAAGISRFKAKKIEAQRRLERVEQNLLRLQDIVDEVENRLKSVRNQAGKAKKYKEYADRLQSLRTQVGLADWRKLTSQLAQLEAELIASRDEAASASAEAESLEARSLALDVKMVECDEAIRATELRVADCREQIASREATIDHERRRVLELEKEIARHRQHLTTMSLRAGDIEHQAREIETLKAEVEARHQEHARLLGADERRLSQLTTELDELRKLSEQRRSQQLEQLKIEANLEKQIGLLDARLTAIANNRQLLQQRLAETEHSCAALADEQTDAEQNLAAVTDESVRLETAHRAAQVQLTDRRRQLAETQKTLGHTRERLSAAAERTVVLEELEKRLEGVAAGARELLVRSREAETGPLSRVRGLVADVFHVEIETARTIEIALGEIAQHVIVTGDRELIDLLQTEDVKLPGRVGILRLDAMPASTAADTLDLNGLSGVVGRADRFVETTPEYSLLARRLLGRTWVVETLAHALALHDSVGRGVSFVTLGGELLTADGLIQMGPRQSAVGLISRRSELRTLKLELAELERQTQGLELARKALDVQILQDDEAQRKLGDELREASRIAIETRSQAAAVRQRLQAAQQQLALLNQEVNSAENESAQLTQSGATARQQLADTETRLRELQVWLAEDTRRLSELDGDRQHAMRETSTAKIELARIEQQLADLRGQHQQLARDQQERERGLVDTEQHLNASEDRRVRAEQTILSSESAVALLYLQKETESRQSLTLVEEREAARAEKMALTQQSQKSRNRARKLESQLHVKELAANEARHERTALADRLRDDYGIELAALEHEPTREEISERQAVEAEISDLRSKLNQLGSVNLEALNELEELETRFTSLSSQFQDLTEAKESLEQIIHKINADSRRLFAETLEVVRGHFQQLFRKLFGGGQADIVLDEGVDILESGIEIVARPPGKEPRNISLLSGGEKTLTCVALLLSIFRSKPSPFCVLDEVDAALDEANIDRFVNVLKEFLNWTQFIVVTHSKKTMTAASTLYGVTMQESGISKRVSVRFEDVTETGEFRKYEDIDPSGETQAA
jgi:chromosome segregation protein